MKIQRNNADKNYPFLISDGWGGQVSLKFEDLETLKERIEEIKIEEANRERVKVAKEGIEAIKQICQDFDCSICPIRENCERVFGRAVPKEMEWD